MTGYGRGGPQENTPAYDVNIQAACGLMEATGTTESGPIRAGAPVLDYATALAASFATILSVILTTGLHFLMGDFMWQSAVATLFILIPCVLFVVGVIPMPRRNAGDAVER